MSLYDSTRETQEEKVTGKTAEVFSVWQELSFD